MGLIIFYTSTAEVIIFYLLTNVNTLLGGMEPENKCRLTFTSSPCEKECVSSV